ncbi:ras GTPase-activating protein 3 [Galendromus occidentalis]|uniref:Ras GTPase-activating protein 3 n=1 Tax=Galendromus occidentalis TaxID=34638 RepID=A0AAJ7SDF4_9ACAR|nr:ras GTPase-activating protein 3 [Galendromus occidentalis]
MAWSLGDQVRTIEKLAVIFGEAKNLPPKGSCNADSGRDVYCSLRLDQEEIYRTSVFEKTLNPFIAEQFRCDIPRDFHLLNIYVNEREKVSNKDKVIGRVSLSRGDILKFHAKEHWFNIEPVDADSEVQGKIHLFLALQHFQNGLQLSSIHPLSEEELFRSGAETRLVLRIAECCDLNTIRGYCDPYAVVALYRDNVKVDQKRTKALRKTSRPSFEETFDFFLPRDWDRFEVKVSLYHDVQLGSSVFLGEVRLGCSAAELRQQEPVSAWYYLGPREEFSKKNNYPELGALRLKLHFTSDTVFPSSTYDQLRQLIVSSWQVQPITCSAAYIISQLVPAGGKEAITPLVRVLSETKQIVKFLRAVAEHEMSNTSDATTLFRGNSLLSRCVDEFMKFVGMQYLQSTLRSLIDRVLSERKPCEIDPTKLSDEAKQLPINTQNLKSYADEAFEAITKSAAECPPILRELFNALKRLAAKRFPKNSRTQYSVVSVFVFLRFFAAAILNPKLFDLCPPQRSVDPQANRTLTLISKVVQSVGNLTSKNVEASRARVGERQNFVPYKEEYMWRFYSQFLNESHPQKVTSFLEMISSNLKTISALPRESNNSSPPVVLKQGSLTKRAQNRNKLGLKQFKKRYFFLTSKALCYSKNKDGNPLCEIPLDEVLGVERLREESFRLNNVLQIVQPSGILYIQCNNCVEEQEWLDLLRRLTASNRHKVQAFHPDAFINGEWLCCRSRFEGERGCSPVSRTELGAQVDLDRELERLHSLVISNWNNFEALTENCDTILNSQSQGTLGGLRAWQDDFTLSTSFESSVASNSGTSTLTDTLNNNLENGDVARTPTYIQEDVNKTADELRAMTVSGRKTSFEIDDARSMKVALMALAKCAKELENWHRRYRDYQKTGTVRGTKQAPISLEDNYIVMKPVLSSQASHKR